MAARRYAISHLNSRLLVVTGHTNCGAVTAAVQHVRACMDHDDHGDIVITKESVTSMMQARSATPSRGPGRRRG